VRYRIAVVAVAGLLAVGFGGSFTLGPPATTTADRFSPTVATGQSGGTFYSEGDVVEKRSIAVSERGAIRTEVTFATVTGVRYWNGSEESVYRVEAANESVVDRVVDAHSDSEIVNRSEGVAVVEAAREQPEPEEWWNGSLVMTYLQVPEYERVGTETRRNNTVVLYEPSSSFVRTENIGEQTVHLTNPSGEIVVDADTRRLLSADLSYELVSAKSWGDYLLNGVIRDSAQVRVTYEYQPDATVTPVERNAS
jgi:hypothetical protein